MQLQPQHIGAPNLAESLLGSMKGTAHLDILLEGPETRPAASPQQASPLTVLLLLCQMCVCVCDLIVESTRPMSW